MNKQIIITGSNWENCGDYSKITSITDEEFEYIRPIIERISHTSGYNWTWGTDLQRINGEWRTVKKIFKMYNTEDPKRLEKFCKFVPRGIDKIIGIKVQRIIEDVYM